MTGNLDRYITPEAVQAAAKALHVSWLPRVRARAALTAALPHIEPLIRADERRRRNRCTCGWCCTGVRPEDRGDTHKLTCSPRTEEATDGR